jgi:hypothetical protein
MLQLAIARAKVLICKPECRAFCVHRIIASPQSADCAGEHDPAMWSAN